MKAIYKNSGIPEKEAKKRFCFPENVMMENAASALENEVMARNPESVLILCGSGNNGGDGYTLSRRIFGRVKNLLVLSFGEPKTDEAVLQKKISLSVGVKIIDSENFENSDVFVACKNFEAKAFKSYDVFKKTNVFVAEKFFETENCLESSDVFVPAEIGSAFVIVDCVYGTGFHGELPENVVSVFDFCNKLHGLQNVFKIACDIPSGIDCRGIVQTFCGESKIAFCADENKTLKNKTNFCENENKTSENKIASRENENKTPERKIAFLADKTVTMGALKSALFSDEAKDFVGEIKVADLGISSAVFESCGNPDAFLIEEKDIKLPLRTKKSVHKGNFGHSLLVLGEKCGAGIIAGTAALRFGSGFVSLLKTDLSENGEKFFMSPELMISDEIPEKTNAVLLGSGLGRSGNRHSAEIVEKVIENTIDFVMNMKNPAAVFDADFFYCKNLKSVLKKLNDLPNARIILTPHPKELCELLNACGIADENGKKIEFHSLVLNRFEYAERFSQVFPNLTLIAKGANTFVFSEGKAFVCDRGTSALAKAGSGDVLAGLCLSLLSQNYSAKDAAITSVFMHAAASKRFEFNFECTPFSLIEKLD